METISQDAGFWLLTLAALVWTGGAILGPVSLGIVLADALMLTSFAWAATVVRGEEAEFPTALAPPMWGAMLGALLLSSLVVAANGLDRWTVPNLAFVVALAGIAVNARRGHPVAGPAWLGAASNAAWVVIGAVGGSWLWVVVNVGSTLGFVLVARGTGAVSIRDGAEVPPPA